MSRLAMHDAIRPLRNFFDTDTELIRKGLPRFFGYRVAGQEGVMALDGSRVLILLP